MRDFSIYNRALSTTEVKDLAADPTAITGVQLDSLSDAIAFGIASQKTASKTPCPRRGSSNA